MIHVVDLASATRSTIYRPRHHRERDFVKVLLQLLKSFLSDAEKNNMRIERCPSAMDSRIPSDDVEARGGLCFKSPEQTTNGPKLNSKAMGLGKEDKRLALQNSHPSTEEASGCRGIPTSRMHKWRLDAYQRLHSHLRVRKD